MPSSVDVVLCRCQEEAVARLDMERLIEKLNKNKKISNVHLVDHLCSIEGMKRFIDVVQGSNEHGLVVAACASKTLYQRIFPSIKTIGIPEQTCAFLPMRELILWSYQGENTLQAARDLIKIAVNKIKKVTDVGNWSAQNAVINYLKCDKCKRCMEECPVDAYSLNAEGYPEVNPLLCQQCGICVGSCPVQCISLPNLRIEELSGEIRSIKGDGSNEPTILSFCCEPLTYPALIEKVTQGTTLPQNMRVIDVPCMGAVNPALINDALTAGIDGVLLMGCEQGSCQIRQGGLLAKRRLENLKETLQRMRFENERVQYLGWPEQTGEGVIVDPNRCNGCLTCQKVCPFDAVTVISKTVRGKERLVTERNARACRSCGVCAANCPSGACQPIGSNDQQLLNMLDTAIMNTVKTTSSDAVVLCNCNGKLEQYIDFEQLQKELSKQGIGQVLIEPQLCTESTWTELSTKFNSMPRNGIVGACAMDIFGRRIKTYQNKTALASIQFTFTDLWEQSIIQPTDREKATALCNQAILSARAGMETRDNLCKGFNDNTVMNQIISTYANVLRGLGPNPFKET